jgi:6,7-dimethyl-8-ribityllumazine synthase
MARIIEGTLDGGGLKIGVVVSRFNDFLTGKLLDGALDCLTRHGVATDDVTVAKTPGAFELPLAVKKMADSGGYDVIIALGAVIRGATPHFEYVSSEATKGLASAMMESGVPVAFGLLTVDTIEQGIERSGAKSGNKGFDAALTALEMASLMKKL